jgi:hypothetical protein
MSLKTLLGSLDLNDRVLEWKFEENTLNFKLNLIWKLPHSKSPQNSPSAQPCDAKPSRGPSQRLSNQPIAGPRPPGAERVVDPKSVPQSQPNITPPKKHISPSKRRRNRIRYRQYKARRAAARTRSKIIPALVELDPHDRIA